MLKAIDSQLPTQHNTFNHHTQQMNIQEIDNTVKRFLVEELEMNEATIKPDARLKEDIGIDSLDYVDIAIMVEEKFGFRIRPDEMKQTKTYADFCNFIAKRLTA